MRHFPGHELRGGATALVALVQGGGSNRLTTDCDRAPAESRAHTEAAPRRPGVWSASRGNAAGPYRQHCAGRAEDLGRLGRVTRRNVSEIRRRLPRKIARTGKKGWRSTTGTDIRHLTSV
jgi:hypothetical protein